MNNVEASGRNPPPRPPREECALDDTSIRAALNFPKSGDTAVRQAALSAHALEADRGQS